MTHFGAFLLLIGLASGQGALAQSEVLQTTWNCKDAAGRTTLTNVKEETVGKDCKVVSQQRVTTVPSSKAAAKSPAGFPKESAGDRAASKVKQRETIERELAQEQQMLESARRKLAEQESQRSGDEKNYARVLERLQPYKDAIEVHEKNIAALRREISNLR
jgi:septal ring factor EnvC (AmiA/AmiB activator)